MQRWNISWFQLLLQCCKYNLDTCFVYISILLWCKCGSEFSMSSLFSKPQAIVEVNCKFLYFSSNVSCIWKGNRGRAQKQIVPTFHTFYLLFPFTLPFLFRFLCPFSILPLECLIKQHFKKPSHYKQLVYSWALIIPRENMILLKTVYSPVLILEKDR